MTVDPEINNVQVIIIANTRELIRQVEGVLNQITKNTKITTCIGDQKTKDLAHILVTVPGWISSRLKDRRNKLDLSAVKLVCFDEADEIFLQEKNQ